MGYNNKPLDQMYKKGERVTFIGDNYSDPTMQENGQKPDIRDGDIGEIVHVEPAMMIVAFTPRSWTPKPYEELLRSFKKRMDAGERPGRYASMIGYLKKSSQSVAFKYLFEENVGKLIKKCKEHPGDLEKRVEDAK